MIKTEKEKISHGKNTPRQTNEQGDLFGFDDSAIKTAETLSKLAAKHIREVGEKVNAAKHAIKNPEAARKLGVKVKKDAQKLLDNALLEQQKWEHWYTDSELTGLLRKEAGISDNSVIKENLTTETSDAQKTGNIEQSKKATAKENLTVEAPGTSGESTAAGDEALLDKYEQRFGNVINTDNMKLLLPGYDPHSEKSVVDAHKTAAPLTGKMFDRMLEKLQKGDTVIFTGGGNGSGKSSVLSQSPDAVFVMDSTMANADITRKSVQDVLDRGGKVVLAFAYRNPHEAWFKGVLKRNKSTDGHIVPKNTFTNTHSKAKQNFIQLAEEFGNKVELRIRDNDTGKIISLDELKQKPNYTKEEILEVINGVRYGEIRQGVSAENQSDNGGRSAGEIEQRRAKISGTQAGAVEPSGRVSGEKEKGLTVSVPQNYKTFDENGDWRLSKPAGELAEDFVSALDSGKKLISQLADGRSIRYRKDGDSYTVTGVKGKERTFSRNGIHSFIMQDLFREDRTVTEDTERVSSVDEIRGFTDEMLHDLNTLSVGDYAMFGGSKKYPATYTGQVVSVGSKNIKLKVKSDMYGERIIPFPREEYKGHWTKNLIEQKRHYSIKNVWTGSAADYDEPSLQYVGTGEGAQVYGWGLYAADNRRVAEWYAEQSTHEKAGGKSFVLVRRSDGKAINPGNSDKIEVILWNAAKNASPFGIPSIDEVRREIYESRRQALRFEDRPEKIEEIAALYGQAADRLGEYDVADAVQGRRHLYKQTFWPDKEENLLLWNEEVTEEQKAQILDELSAMESNPAVVSFVNRERDDWQIDEETGELEEEPKYYPQDVLRDYLDTYLDFYEATGEYVYKQLADLFGSPQAASEFLYRAGIDGIKYPANQSEGVDGWNYVAFSDKDIRVDEHILYQSEFAIPRPDITPLSAEEQAEVDRQRAEVRSRYAGTDLWMKAPNGAPTNLSEDLWIAVRTPFFKKWFGDWEKKVERPVGGAPSEDSAPFTSDQSLPPRVSHGYGEYSTENPNVKFLLDENGEPLIVHHGTNARFLYFSIRSDIGYHFGTEEHAENRAAVVSEENGGTPGIYSGFVSLRNPLYISTDFGSWRGNDVAAKLLERNAPAEARGEIGVFYVDANKAAKYSVFGALMKNYQHKEGIFDSFIHNIHEDGSPVKGVFKDQTETLQAYCLEIKILSGTSQIPLTM